METADIGNKVGRKRREQMDNHLGDKASVLGNRENDSSSVGGQNQYKSMSTCSSSGINQDQDKSMFKQTEHLKTSTHKPENSGNPSRPMT